MPIFEFRCLKCGELFEKLLLNSDEMPEVVCPACKSQSFERVVSKTNHVMGVGPGGKQPTLTERSCGPSNQCMTLELPGPAK